MELANLEQAIELGKELSELRMCSDLLQGGANVVIQGGAMTFSQVNNQETKQNILKCIFNRMDEICDTLKKL